MQPANDFVTRFPEITQPQSAAIKSLWLTTITAAVNNNGRIDGGGSDGIGDGNDNRIAQRRPGFVDYTLIVLGDEQRIPLLAVLSLVVIQALVGNLATVVVNSRRPVRPFFRVCLLSLAAGDLISIIFQSTSYVAQLTSIYPPIWTLGAFMCSAVPFMTTWAVLVNSFVLVAIALDRYVAVGKVWKMPKGWEPTLLVCIGVAAVAWTLGAAIAVPMLTGYETVDVFVIATDPANRTIQVDVWPAQVCVGGKEANFTYYASVFSAMYLPTVLAFLWLNGVIANEIWRRRRSISSQSSKCSNNSRVNMLPPTNATARGAAATGSSSDTAAFNNAFVLGVGDEWTAGKRSTETPTNSQDVANATDPTKNASPPNRSPPMRSSREIRQLRMFRAIMCIMFVFLACRLPGWIYLLYKLKNSTATATNWVLQYAFGILSLCGCALNPLLYTFLAETIDATSASLDRVRIWWRLHCQCSCGAGNGTAGGGRRASTHATFGDWRDRLGGRTAATDRTTMGGGGDGQKQVIKPTQFYFSEDSKVKLARVN